MPPIDLDASELRQSLMIHHMSIGAREPAGAARALAELLGGDVTPFGPPPGSFIAWVRDDSG